MQPCIQPPKRREPEHATEVEIDGTEAYRRLLHQFGGHIQHTVENISAFGQRIHQVIGIQDPFRQRVDPMLGPEGVIAVTCLLMNHQFHLREGPVRNMGMQHHPRDIALADGHQRKGIAIHRHRCLRNHQIGIQLFREPMSLNDLVQLLDANTEQSTLLVRLGLHILNRPAIGMDGHHTTQPAECAASHRME